MKRGWVGKVPRTVGRLENSDFDISGFG